MIEDIINNCRRTANGRRIFTSDQKATIVLAWEKSGVSGLEFCRRHGLIVSLLYKWRKDSMRGATMGIKNEGELYAKTELEALRKENEELKKLVAEKELDNRILKKMSELSRGKKD